MTYDLRRLRLHGLIERIDGTHRYRATDAGIRTAVFFTRAYHRLLRTGLAQLNRPLVTRPLRHAFTQPEAEMDLLVTRSHLAA